MFAQMNNEEKKIEGFIPTHGGLRERMAKARLEERKKKE
jgi:four helix bundle suffix protein